MSPHLELLHAELDNNLREGLSRNRLLFARFGIFRLFSRLEARVNLLQGHFVSSNLPVD